MAKENIKLNLPINDQKNIDSASDTKKFFNTYTTDGLSFPSNQVDAVIGFFENKGFERESAISVSTVLLRQAKIDQVNVFELIDTLKNLDRLQLSNIVAQVLNYNRDKISTIGFKIQNTSNLTEKRNIVI